ncbi:MAG TPA: thioesterase family protein [Pyrinomonadaceae bacterium]|nr:thioesterase family protein [Pyrinomonadaceae bacterium]
MIEPVEDDALFDEWDETVVRVRYAETDRMGVVYHANYLVWFEIGRTEFCRSRGFAYRDMEENDNAFLVVAESYCRYKAPARYDDELVVRTHITELRRRSVRFGYEIIRLPDGQIIAEGETGHVVTDPNGRVISMPEAYRTALSSPPLPASPRVERVPENDPPE